MNSTTEHIEIIPQKPVILYDGLCNFCNEIVNFILKHDEKNIFLISPLQTREARRLLRKANTVFISMKTVYLVENGVAYKHSEAIFRMFHQLPYPWKLISYLRVLPVFFTDFFYRLIARNRYKWFGRREALHIPAEIDIPRYLPRQ